jgi:hypothetical protein
MEHQKLWIRLRRIRGGVGGGGWWLEKWIIIPGVLGKVRRWYPPYPRRIRYPFADGIFLNSNFIFQILNYYPRRTGSQFASDIPLYPQRISSVFSGVNGE